MEYSVEQAKSIFDLIRSVSPYAMPLLISLIFPLVWVLLKKVLGISKSEKEKTTSPSSNYLEKAMHKLMSAFSLDGEHSDRLVFYCCILLFLAGGILLKVGEHNEEVVRQRALELKRYMEIHNYLGTYISNLNDAGFDDGLIRKIRFNYPNDFVAYNSYDSSGKAYKALAIVDTATVKKIKKYVYSLLESYLNEKFKNKCQVDMDSLSLWDKNELKRLFGGWIVYSYLSEQLNKEKYNLDVINDRTVVKKIE